MQTDLLFERFDDLLATPDDVRHLEAAILQLAVQGKLVPQDLDDEPAVVLLERNVAKRKSLEENGEIKPFGELSPISPDEILYDLPENWVWCRLGEVTTYGISDKVGVDQVEVGTWVLDLKDIEKTTSRLLCKKRVGEYDFKSTKSRFFRGDVLYGKLRPYLDKVIVADEDGVCTTEIIPLHGYVDIDPYFLRLCLKRPDFIAYANGNTYGMNLPRLNTQDARMALLPLAPLAEQKRIVAAVDALLAQTRALAAGLEQADTALIPAAQAAFQALPDAFRAPAGTEDARHAWQRAAWQRVADHFDALTNDPRTIAALKQTILQLAVEGKLVPQNSEDEPARVLLERIEAEQAHAVSEEQAKKSKRPPPISEQEQPYKIPEGWVWTHLPEIGELARGKSRHRPRNAPELYENGKYPFIQTGDVAQSGGKITSYTTMYGDVGLAQSRMWKKGTLCITIAANIAETGILQFDACFPDSVVGFVPSELVGSVEYFQYLIQVAKNQLEAYAPATAQKNINLGILQNLLIPLPPANEIKRIVAKVEGLLALCDALAAGVVQAEAVRARVLGAVLNGESPATNRP